MINDKNLLLLILLAALISGHMYMQLSRKREGFIRSIKKGLRPSMRNFRSSKENFKKRLGNSFVRAKRSIFGIKL